MTDFLKDIRQICKKNKKVAMFIDMDGTIVELKVYTDKEFDINDNKFRNGKPIKPIIKQFKKLSKISNLDLYILSLARDDEIVNEKKEWLSKNIKFIPKENWILLSKKSGEYNSDNKPIIKSQIIKEKLNEYDYALFVDDEHKIIINARNILDGKAKVFHPSSILV